MIFSLWHLKWIVGTDLEHKEDGVEYNEGHDEVLEWSGLNQTPQLVLVAVSLLARKNLNVFQTKKNINKT